MRITGEVSSGLGRAHVFMSQKHYQSQFKVVLGVGAWPGTLNVDVGSDSLGAFSPLRFLAGREEGDANESVTPLRIEGFGWEGLGSSSAGRRPIRESNNFHIRTTYTVTEVLLVCLFVVLLT